MAKGTILIVEAGFYEDLAEELRVCAIAALTAAGYPYEVLCVPGALEIAPAIAMAIKSRKYKGFVALGTVIRGETSHYDYVAGLSIKAVQDLAVENAVPIGTGILTVENAKQAWKRAGRNQGNKGARAVEACLALIEARAKLLGS